MKPLTKEQLDRCQIKEVVTDFLSLFDGPFLYTPMLKAPQGGTHHPYPPGYMFMSAIDFDPASPQGLPVIQTFERKYMGDSLSAKPTEAVLAACDWRCMDGRINSLKLIPWKEYGHALLVATDKTQIPSIHVAFIPLENIPTITMDNTERWKP